MNAAAVVARRGLSYPCRVLPFPATQRSVLERVRSADAEIRRAAFGDLAHGYWRPSYHYLRLHWRLAPEDAEDAVQAFFTTAFEKRYVEAYDPAKARFRTFLRTCLDRFVQNRRKAERAAKRGGETDIRSLDFPGAERDLAEHLVTEIRDVDRFFRDETIRALFSRTVDEMRRAYADEGRDAVFLVFERYDLHAARADDPGEAGGPIGGDKARTYAEVARELGLSTTQVTNHLHAARRRFRELALLNLRALVGTDEEYRAEARELFGLEIHA
jgi:RNA polymerase sigma factor (sigma-70 family)